MEGRQMCSIWLVRACFNGSKLARVLALHWLLILLITVWFAGKGLMKGGTSVMLIQLFHALDARPALGLSSSLLRVILLRQ